MCFLVTPANGAKIVSRNLKIVTHSWHTCESHLLRVCCTLVYLYSSSDFTGWVDSGWDLSTANPFHHQPDFSKNDFDDDHHYQSSWLISSLPFDKRRPASQFTPFQTRPALQSPAWEAGGDGGGWSGWSWGWGGWSIIIDHVNFNNDLRWAGQKDSNMDSTFVKAIWLAHGELRTIIQHLELVWVGFRRGGGQVYEDWVPQYHDICWK